jgi:D-alanyl-D-alanine carboxypeptidase
MRVLSCALAAAIVFMVGAAPPSPPVIPNTQPGRILRAWLAAFDSGDRATLKRFLQAHEPQRVPQIDDLMQFREDTGGFDLRAVEQSSATKMTVLLQEHLSDQFARLVFEVKPSAPQRIVNASLMAIRRPPAFAIPHLTQAQLIDQLQSRLQQQSAAGAFSGAVLIAKDGKPIFERAYGLADRAHHIPNTVETKFRIGSMNKMFTATAIMQLVQAGKIDLDAPFGTYVTDYPNKSVSSAVTIRQLLTHTGGTGDIFGPLFDKNRLKLRTLQDYVKLYGNRGLAFKPGTKFDYSNYGFILLGVVVERVSGQTYYDYVREHIYAPAGMSSSGSEFEDVADPKRSIGYTMEPSGAWVPNTGTLTPRASSAGGGLSTAGDLLAFANALQNGTLLKPAYETLMTTGKVPMGPDSPLKYAFGFGDGVENGVRCYGHNGGAPGMNGDLHICANGYTFAVLSNLDPPAAERVADFIDARLPLRH